jgi:hypothetical protein
MRPSGIAFVLVALVGCGNGTTGNDAGGHHAATPTCDMILARCHPLDTGLGEIHECHELAESTAATAEADCMAMQTHCFDVCTPADTGGVDAGM